MSHEIQYFDYSITTDKKRIETELNDYARHATWQEGGSGLYSSIRWIDKIFETYSEAQQYIDRNDRGDYDQLAVKYKEYGSVDKTKLTKYNELSAKCKEAYDKVNKLENTNHFKEVKAAYIGCPHCGSKINREIYTTKWTAVKPNYCPVCRESMLKDTMLKQIESAKEKHKKLQEQAKAEYEKQQKKNKPTERWLVKIEYHV